MSTCIPYIAGAGFYEHDTLKGALQWYDAIEGSTGVVNLAGAPISTRWDEGVKKSLVSSRLIATKRVVVRTEVQQVEHISAAG